MPQLRQGCRLGRILPACRQTPGPASGWPPCVPERRRSALLSYLGCVGVAAGAPGPQVGLVGRARVAQRLVIHVIHRTYGIPRTYGVRKVGRVSLKLVAFADTLEALPHEVRLRGATPARFGLDFGGQSPREPHRDRSCARRDGCHERHLIHALAPCNTSGGGKYQPTKMAPTPVSANGQPRANRPRRSDLALAPLGHQQHVAARGVRADWSSFEMPSQRYVAWADDPSYVACADADFAEVRHFETGDRPQPR